ncbi:hypothetical protein [Bradyrhizobium sp. SZCCHNR2026]|uniref:hypothetical protein n=1 Tax=Bradyrhizobium sp. SZCCHNR2026 TaxID=3057381 RepID=UPI002916B29A|nr:hypothetical protein [Bradyrhizobium sp. SZCCHNR2026]
MSADDSKKIEQTLAEALKLAKNPEGARNILAMLFPRAENVFRTFIPSDSDRLSQTLKRRISKKEFTESYFSLTPNQDTWSVPELKSAIEGPPSEAFDVLREKTNRASPQQASDLRRIFLELLDSHFSSSQQLNEGWMKAIVSASPELLSFGEDERDGFFSLSSLDRLRGIVIRGIKELPPTSQIAILESAIQSANDFSLLADVVRSLIGDLNPDGAKGRSDQLQLRELSGPLRNQLIERIREVSRTGDIWKQADPSPILWFWRGSNAEDEVKKFTTAAMKSGAGLRRLFEIAISEVLSTDGNYEQVPIYWDKIVDLDALSRQAHELVETSKNDEEIAIARRFLNALENGRKDRFS